MKKVDKGFIITGIISFFLALIMLIVTLFVFCFDAGEFGVKSLKKAWDWGSDKVEEYYD